MSLGIWQLIVILAIVLILFGRGKIASIMSEFGKGIKSFKKEVKTPAKKISKKKK
jgi:sec-independent protein translocase protein TatA